MENRKMQIKETIKSIVEDSTIHGIPRLVKPNSWFSKIAWILCFICSISYCIYLIIAAVLSYLQYDVITAIETITEIPAALPVVTICNLNQLQTNYSFNMIQKYSNLPIPNIVRNMFLTSELAFENDTFKKSLSYSLDESMINCTINAMPSCFPYDFVWNFHPTYGNCYSYNTGFNSSGNKVDMKNIIKPGSLWGLRLELFIGNPNSIPEFVETSGYHVIIHNQTYALSLNEGFDISTGLEANVVINKLYQTMKQQPYSKCIDLNSIDSFDSYLYRVIYSSNKKYRQVDCFELCFQQKLINTCRCYSAGLAKLNGTIPCVELSQIECIKNTYNLFISNDYITNVCIQYCPLECSSINYQVTTSFSNYPTKKYAKSHLMNDPRITSKFPNETLTYDLIKQSVLSLNVYYDQLSYTQISKDAKLDLVDLISGIGGLLGLFLGMSFLSFAEFIEMIIEAIIIILTKKNVMRINVN